MKYGLGYPVMKRKSQAIYIRLFSLMPNLLSAGCHLRIFYYNAILKDI
ncbi:hypothetical protein CLOSTHATH_03156 [Hungatella hathewayi DSM 13479]|uniref:Uncharacterized protein n=1 Tax=Hungatella hathewayi DSM 13479 TaxID=566550 RepID=D3AHR7_9FIRM|nr:hypothetical protein CLOSTHATH_03156 [Hungatella hathewayi DSM 13479]